MYNTWRFIRSRLLYVSIWCNLIVAHSPWMACDAFLARRTNKNVKFGAWRSRRQSCRFGSGRQFYYGTATISVRSICIRIPQIARWMHMHVHIVADNYVTTGLRECSMCRIEEIRPALICDRISVFIYSKRLVVFVPERVVRSMLSQYDVFENLYYARGNTFVTTGDEWIFNNGRK